MSLGRLIEAATGGGIAAGIVGPGRKQEDRTRREHMEKLREDLRANRPPPYEQRREAVQARQHPPDLRSNIPQETIDDMYAKYGPPSQFETPPEPRELEAKAQVRPTHTIQGTLPEEVLYHR